MNDQQSVRNGSTIIDVNNFLPTRQSLARRYLSAMRDQQLALLLGCVVFALGGCKKDKDDEAPTVHIQAPLAGSTLAIPGTITISAHVVDDNSVEVVTAEIVDANGVPIAPSTQATVNSASATVQLEITVNSERITSGTYTVVVRATDGENDGRAFLDINVLAAPLRVRSVFVLPPITSAPPYTITRLDSTGTTSTWATVTELSGCTIDLDHLYLAGTTTEPLTRWNVNTGSTSLLLNNDGVPGGSLSYFHGLKVDPTDHRTYTGTLDGALRGFNTSGAGVFAATSPTGLYSEMNTVVNDLVVSAAIEPVSGSRTLVNHAYSSGVLLGQFPLDVVPTALFAHGTDQLFVFGNRNGNGVLQERNVQSGGVYEMQLFASDPLRAVAQVNESTYLIALQSGIIKFTYQNNGISPISSGMVANAIVYEPASGSMLVGTGNQLITIDPNTGALLDTRSMPHEVGTILLLMNR